MTDNTQELDEILLRLWMGDEWLKQFNSEPVKQKPRFIEAKQAILDWHNKQVLEMLKDEQHDDERSVSAFKYMGLNKLKEGSNEHTR